MKAQRLFSTADAASYLGLSIATVKYHVYQSGALRPDAKIGKTLVFTRSTLDEFAAQKRRPGRPRTSHSSL